MPDKEFKPEPIDNDEDWIKEKSNAELAEMIARHYDGRRLLEFLAGALADRTLLFEKMVEHMEQLDLVWREAKDGPPHNHLFQRALEDGEDDLYLHQARFVRKDDAA